KALAFNTLLSSQETDTHRTGSAFAFPAPGRLILTLSDPLGLSIPGFSDTPFRIRLRGSFPAVLLFHQIRPDCQIDPFPTHPDDAGATKSRQLIEDGSPGPAAVRRPALPWGEVNSMPKRRGRQTSSHAPMARTRARGAL
ncbi:hypothetical protein AB0C87_41290, partial [Actinomadura sp. NPDC048021]|uniref:hypothetical protein n=1 Tax=Actinomadura sp. NPDC048021 TaxID=3155385 RepID=UPI0033D55ADA